MKDRKEFDKGAYVNPFTDAGFKIIFGSPASKPFLITLLNELLRGEHEIEDLTLIDKEDRADNIYDRCFFYDLYCRTSTGEYIIVEMQNSWHPNFLDRSLVYVCRSVSNQVAWRTAGDDAVYSELKRRLGFSGKYRIDTVYGIFLMNFAEPCLERKCRTDVYLIDPDTGRVVNGHLRQIYIQFPFFTKGLDECETLYDKLIYALKYMNTWERMPDKLHEQVFHLLEEIASKGKMPPEERMAYEHAVDQYWVEIALAEDNRRKMAEARMQGRAEGEAKGRAEGKVETARNMKLESIPDSVIAKVTGLPLDVIDGL